ncbi:Oxidoreductase, molybdopterin-binding domain-containing protein [Halteromyces radiatus]|uniref:Oxidoreductase, molybdopterin-binding domain-containing protein n=1 Tax=Halteromyces radiatus TaxID=101107 RepID=UPI00222026DF|nr:Oxidoreductase, molybdopterin-binding domain-containing protein [Halteromyces radiatus]KAI8099036.1 Oxidoreductase, molybdopterin-binding domain-containing protein [Halteromyces radiatus]
MSKQLDYSYEPSRQDLKLEIRKDKPFNAEPTPPDLVKAYITPLEHFFCRSHGPLPKLDDHHVISIQGIGLETAQQFTVEQLKQQFKKKTIVMAMQCAGNRRDGLHKVKDTKGVIWGPGAIGNGSYAGCRLKDVLGSIGINCQLPDIGSLHVAFESVEQCEEDRCYGSSIPLSKALDEFGDVLLAYEMNDAPLTQDHGAPIRVVVPGYIGARSVKFLKSIIIQNQESSSYFQQRDYKILPSHIETEQQAAEYWCKVPSIGEFNVQSYVCDPADGQVESNCRQARVSGYALSGGGRGIQRVDVSGDDGKTWKEAILYQPKTDSTTTNMWGWCLWTVEINVKRNTRIVSRAVDTSGNIQQEYPVWNYRGVMNNSWRTIDRRDKNNAVL